MSSGSGRSEKLKDKRNKCEVISVRGFQSDFKRKGSENENEGEVGTKILPGSPLILLNQVRYVVHAILGIAQYKILWFSKSYTKGNYKG